MQVNYAGVATSDLFAGGFNIRIGAVRFGKKEFVFTNKATGGSTTRFIPLDRLGKDPKAEETEKARKRRYLQNKANRASENRSRKSVKK